MEKQEGKMATLSEAELALAIAVVEALNLDTPAEQIDPELPRYGREGYGLDSIDMLEIALVVSRNYGFQLRSDSEDNVRIFRSLRSLSQHIEAHRTK
jgi:acyl carrier protein